MDSINQELTKEEDKCFKASTSKVLTENTPPTTPDVSPNPYISEELDSTATNDTSQITSTSVVPSGEVTAPLSSPDHNDSKSEVATSATSTTVGDKETENGQQRKRRRKNTNERSSKSKHAESESEEETGKSQSKKRKKKKPKPDIPCAPPPLKPEVLASMSSEERIKVLHDHLCEMRRVYQQLKQEVQSIDRKRKRAKRREQEAAELEKEKKSSSSPPHNKKQPSSPANNAKNGCDVDTTTS